MSIAIVLFVILASPFIQATNDLTNANGQLVDRLEIEAKSPDCAANVFSGNVIGDSSQEDNTALYRRGGSCSAEELKIAPNTETEQNPIVPEHSAAETDLGCTDDEYQIDVTCGGPEIRAGRGNRDFAPYFSIYIANCVRGWETPLNERWGFHKTTLVAKYCCNTFEDKVPWHFALKCEKMPPFVAITRYTILEWDDFEKRTINEWGPPPMSWP